jgi:Putative quorum-sensing-regulated virulence factor
MARTVAMPWGKHKGKPLSDIESGYLCWVVEHCDDVRPDLLNAITGELRSRFGSAPPPPPSHSALRRTPCPDPAVASRVVATGLHTLARPHHPDIVGDTATMQRLNPVAVWLKAMVPK